jgi:hypothetical protein
MRSFVFICGFFFLLFACETGGDRVNGSQSNLFNQTVTLEKLDSIKVDFLGNPIVHDIHPDSKTVLFLDDGPYAQTIILAKFDGTIVDSFSKFGDIPDSYGVLLSSIRFLDGNSFLVYGYNGFMVYDFEGNLKSQKKLGDFKVPSTQWVNMGFGMEKLDNRYVYINQEKPPVNSQEYKKFRLMTWLNPESGEKEPFIEFPESSVFRNGNYFFLKSWFPVYTLEEDRIHVVFGSDPVIYEFEIQPPYSLLSTLPMNLPNYRQFKGSENSNDERLFGMAMISGSVENIKKIDGFYFVAYSPGYNRLDTETYFENKSPEEFKLFRERMQKKYLPKIAILDSLGNLINAFVPKGLVANSMLIRKGELWMLEKPAEEVEQDYFRLFRLELKIEQ